MVNGMIWYDGFEGMMVSKVIGSWEGPTHLGFGGVGGGGEAKQSENEK
jgi:hypothetical protein